MSFEEMLKRLGSSRKTTSFGEWSRSPETSQSKQVDAICNLRGTNVCFARRDYKVRGIPTSKDWLEADVGPPEI